MSDLRIDCEGTDIGTSARGLRHSLDLEQRAWGQTQDD